MQDRRKSLAVITGLSADAQSGSGRFRLTQKFVEGMQAYARAWDGAVCAYFHPSAVDLGNLDHVAVAPRDVDFDMRVVPFGGREFYSELEGRGVVLGMHHLLPDLAERCRDLGVPCVYNPEYTLRTRLQIVRAERDNPLLELRGALWELGEELRVTRQIRIADGLQCNGVPSYLRYGPLNRAPLLYFDGRVRSSAVIDDQGLATANARRRRRQPLHLVFSGRLLRSKGADHLIRLAVALSKRRLPFRMTICGDGALKPALQQNVMAAGLGDVVTLPGVLDFSRELLPFMKHAADVFVCCHRQGDPSCTYLETFSCGVPVVGYANEALTTLLAEADAGATVRQGHVEALADLVAELHDDRERLCNWAYRARQFAARHTMERTFQSRIGHLREVRDGFLARGRPLLDPGKWHWPRGHALKGLPLMQARAGSAGA